MMKITVLTENNSRIDNYLLAEPGLSLLVESGINPEYPLYPCHCCDLKSKIVMSKFLMFKKSVQVMF